MLLAVLLALTTGQHPLYPIPRPPGPNEPIRNPAVPPRLVKMVRPHYSAEALRQRLQNAIDAVRQWRYKPGRDARGRAVRTLVNVSVRFDLSHP